MNGGTGKLALPQFRFLRNGAARHMDRAGV